MVVPFTFSKFTPKFGLGTVEKKLSDFLADFVRGGGQDKSAKMVNFQTKVCCFKL